MYWEAYQDLQTERVQARGMIPIGAITSYANQYGLDPDTLKRIVWKVDNVLLEHWRGMDKTEAARQKLKPSLGGAA